MELTEYLLRTTHTLWNCARDPIGWTLALLNEHSEVQKEREANERLHSLEGRCGQLEASERLDGSSGSGRSGGPNESSRVIAEIHDWDSNGNENDLVGCQKPNQEGGQESTYNKNKIRKVRKSPILVSALLFGLMISGIGTCFQKQVASGRTSIQESNQDKSAKEKLLGEKLQILNDYFVDAQKAFEENDLNRSIESATQAIEADQEILRPYLFKPYHLRGLAFRKRGDLDKAIADFDEAIKINPRVERVYFNRGLSWYQKLAFDKAIEDYTRAIALNPKGKASYLGRGEAHKRKGNFDGAIADFTKCIALDSQIASAYCYRAESFYAKGELKKAKSDLRRALAIRPEDEDIAGKIEIIDLQLQKKGLEEKKRDLNNKSKKLEKEIRIVRGDRFFRRGRQALTEHDYDESIDLFSQAIVNYDENEMYFIFRGNAYTGKNKFAQAQMDYTRAIHVMKSKKEKPVNFASVYGLRGNAAYDQNQLDDAIRDYSISIAYNSKDPLPFALKAACFEKRGQKERARTNYQQALSLDPNYKPALDGLKRLKGR